MQRRFIPALPLEYNRTARGAPNKETSQRALGNRLVKISFERASQIASLNNENFKLKAEYNRIRKSIAEYNREISAMQIDANKLKEREDTCLKSILRTKMTSLAQERTSRENVVHESKEDKIKHRIDNINAKRAAAVRRASSLRHMLASRQIDAAKSRGCLKALEVSLHGLMSEIESKIVKKYNEQCLRDAARQKLKMFKEEAKRTRLKWADAIESRKASLAEAVDIQNEESVRKNGGPKLCEKSKRV